MLTESDSYKLFRLNLLLMLHGFQKHLDFFPSAAKKSSDKLIYMDVQGNGIVFNFDWIRHQIHVGFNREFTRTWDSLDTLIEDLADCIKTWVEHPDNKPIIHQGPAPKRAIKAGEILRDLRSGFDLQFIISKYNLNLVLLEKVITELSQHGMVTQEEFVEYRSKLSDVSIREYMCIDCNQIQFAKLASCPHCGGRMKMMKRNTMESAEESPEETDLDF